LEAVNQVAAWYTERLSGIVQTPVVKDGFYSSWAQYTILMDNEQNRNALQRYLKEKDIPSMIYYPRGLHQQSAYSMFDLPNEWYSNTIEATKRVLSLPMHPYLNEKTIDEICGHIITYCHSTYA